MRCPNCKHQRTTVLMMRPEPEHSAQELNRLCRSCGQRFVTYEHHIRNVKTLDPRSFLRRLAARDAAPPEDLRDELNDLLQDPATDDTCSPQKRTVAA